MQAAESLRRYPTNINHTPRDFPLGPRRMMTATHCRGGSVMERQERVSPAMAALATSCTAALQTTKKTSPGPPSRPAAKVLRKSPSPAAHRPNHVIYRRHSWSSSSVWPPMDLDQKSNIMELDETRLDSGHVSPVDPRPEFPSQDAATVASLLSNANLAKSRPNATFDMAYFLRHTGPPTPAAPEGSKEEAAKPSRKRKGGIFRSKRKQHVPEVIELAAAAAPEAEQQSSVFVPPEGVEQKTTARGKKYLQIVPHPDLLDLGNLCATQFIERGRPLTSPKLSATAGADGLDGWFSDPEFQHCDVVDLGVRAHVSKTSDASNSAAGQSRPRTPQSFVSEAHLQLPSAESGFGLSIIDDPIEQPYCEGPPGRSEALCSNPPSDMEAPPGNRRLHKASLSAGNVELPLIETRLDSMRNTSQNSNRPSIRAVSLTPDRRPTNFLAGARQRWASTGRSFDGMPPSLYPAASIQSRRNREAAIRARKIRALEAAQRNIDQVVQEPPSSPGNLQVLGLDSSVIYESPYQVHTSPPLDDITLLEDGSLSNQRSPKWRGRHGHKPARLLIRENSLSWKNQAVRSSGVSLDPSPTLTPPKQRGRPATATTPARDPPTLPARSSARRTSPPLRPFSPVITATNQPHFSASMPFLSSPLTMSPALQAVTATAYTSTCASTATEPTTDVLRSSHTSASHSARLEARLEAVERENKLLEAALMAVLKTSGTLNRCPCVVLRERAEQNAISKAETTSTSELALGPIGPVSPRRDVTSPPIDTGSQRSSTTPTAQPADAKGGPPIRPLQADPAPRALTPPSPSIYATSPSSTPHSTAPPSSQRDRHRRPSSPSSEASSRSRRVSVESVASGMSALELYLRTKIGGARIGAGRVGGLRGGESRAADASMD